MGERYKSKFTDTRGNYVWELVIIDTDYKSYSDRVVDDGGTVEGVSCFPDELRELVEYKRFELDADGFSLEYGKRGDDAFKPIKGSRVDFTFVCTEDADLDFIDEIASTQEQRYYVRLYRDGVRYWQGPILQDLMRVPYQSYPALVEVQAICGLARLKGLSGVIGQYDNILESIISVLKQLDPDFLWGSSEDFVRTSVRWFENKTWSGSPPNGLDALAYARLERDFTEYTYDNQGSKVYRKWSDWLENILTVFNARIFQSDGLWVIEQIGEIANNPSRYNVYTRAYSYTSGNPSGASGISSSGTSFTPFFQLFGTGDTNRIGRGASWGYLPSVFQYSVNYDLSADSSSQLLFLRSTSSYSSFRNIGADTNFGVSLELQARYHKLVNAVASDQIFYWRVYATVRLVGVSTTYYMIPSSVAGQAIWSTTQGRLLVNDSVEIVPASSSEFKTQVFPGSTFTTASVPVAGLLSVQYEVEFKQFNNPNATNSNISLGTILVSDGSPYYENRGFRAALNTAPSSSEPLDGFEYKVQNTVDTSSSVIKDIGNVWIGDQINSIGTNGQIDVYDVTNNIWTPSELWNIRGVGSGNNRVLELLLIVRMQLTETPKRLFDLFYYGDINPIQAFRVGIVNAKTYLWNWLKLTGRSNFVESESYELDQSATSYNVTSDTVYVDVDFASGLGRLSRNLGAGTLGNGLNGISSPVNGVVGSNQSGTITSIPLNGSLRFTMGYAGDAIQVLQSDGSVQEFILSEDAVQGDTSLSVESQAVSGVIASGARVLSSTSRVATSVASQIKYPLSALPDFDTLLEASGVETTSGLITTWTDASGNANNFTGVDVTPVYKGGFRASLDGASSYLTNGTINVNQPFTLVFLINLKETNTGRYLFKATIGDFSIYTATAPDLTISTGSGPTNATIELPRSVWSVLQIRVNGASSEYRVDYDSWTAITLDGTALIEAPVIGYDGSSNFCQMELAALGIFAIELSDEQANALVNNLKSRIS